MEKIIVARHMGLVEWLRLHGIEESVPVISHVADPDDIKGKHVYGVLPLSLAAECGLITEVSMPLLRPDQRGKELTPEEMDKAGSCLVTYRPPQKIFDEDGGDKEISIRIPADCDGKYRPECHQCKHFDSEHFTIEGGYHAETRGCKLFY